MDQHIFISAGDEGSQHSVRYGVLTVDLSLACFDCGLFKTTALGFVFTQEGQ